MIEARTGAKDLLGPPNRLPSRRRLGRGLALGSVVGMMACAPGVSPPEPTPVQTPAPIPLVGRAEVDDGPTGLFGNGGPPPVRLPWADFEKVELEADGESLRIRFLMRGELPAKLPQGVGPTAFTLSTWRVGKPGRPGIYDVVLVLLSEGEILTEVLAWADRPSSRFDLHEIHSIDGRSVELVVPLARLPALQKPFEWSAMTKFRFVEGDGEGRWWGDAIPDISSWGEYGHPDHRFLLE